MNAEISQPEAFATLHPNLLIGIHRALRRLAAHGQVSGGYYEFGLYRGSSSGGPTTWRMTWGSILNSMPSTLSRVYPLRRWTSIATGSLEVTLSFGSLPRSI